MKGFAVQYPCTGNLVSNLACPGRHIPQISRSTTARVFVYLRNDLVTSRAILVECKMYADADISRGHLPAASR